MPIAFVCCRVDQSGDDAVLTTSSGSAGSQNDGIEDLDIDDTVIKIMDSFTKTRC